MAGKIQQLSKHKIEKGEKYFLDSNVWIFALSNITNPTPSESIYMDFMGKMLENGCIFYSHSLVISEVFNAIARINFKNYKRFLPKDPKNRLSVHQIENLDFKRDYRGSDDYLHNFERFKSEFEIYCHNIHILDREIEIDVAYQVKNIDANSDFNDYLYYEMALDLDLTIITDDGDFNYQEIEILTENQTLLRGIK